MNAGLALRQYPAQERAGPLSRPGLAPGAVPRDPPVRDLVVTDLAVRYGDGPAIFSGVRFALARGEAAALIGANGAGKSSLLRCCLGLIVPSAGAVSVFGRPARCSEGGIGFVAQKHNLVARLSVLTNVLHGLLAGRPGPRHWSQALAPTAARQRAMAALDRVGLADLALRRADSLSGGQSQRVAIARALVAEPRLILADEPAASLDPAAGEEVMAVFLKVVRDSGVTLMFTTHHLDHAVSYADRVLGLCDGRLALDQQAGTLAMPELRRLYA